MTNETSEHIQLVAINDIYVLNPREREKAKFQRVVDSISAVGLKRPIKISRRSAPLGDEGKLYNLVCGQGRLEAFKQLGETEIPAIVVDLSEEDCFLQSLIENLARRRHTPLELVHDLERLTRAGYNSEEIAAKTGLSQQHVKDMGRLVDSGEERLLAAVEGGKIPVSIAVKIAAAKGKDAQEALTGAYENKELRGNKFKAAVRLVNERQRLGKKLCARSSSRKRPITSKAIVREYKRETERQRILVKRADLADTRLTIIKTALQTLFADDNFTTLLHAEGLDTMPSQLAEMIQ